MASREFLKILSSARLGDVLAQQKLASAYLTGDFKTPIQPSNALIWLEKSYISIQNQSLESQSSNNHQVLQTLSSVASVPLASTFNSPAFGFGWDSFWQLATADIASESQTAAKWQLIHLLIDPLHEET